MEKFNNTSIVELDSLIKSRLIMARKRKGLTKKEMADHISVTPPYYSRLEERGIKMTIRQLFELCKILDLEIIHLIDPNVDPFTKEHNNFAPAQICPYCHGNGKINILERGIYKTEICSVCRGKKVIAMIKNK